MVKLKEILRKRKKDEEFYNLRDKLYNSQRTVEIKKNLLKLVDKCLKEEYYLDFFGLLTIAEEEKIKNDKNIKDYLYKKLQQQPKYKKLEIVDFLYELKEDNYLITIIKDDFFPYEMKKEALEKILKMYVEEGMYKKLCILKNKFKEYFEKFLPNIDLEKKLEESLYNFMDKKSKEGDYEDLIKLKNNFMLENEGIRIINKINEKKFNKLLYKKIEEASYNALKKYISKRWLGNLLKLYNNDSVPLEIRKKALEYLTKAEIF